MLKYGCDVPPQMMWRMFRRGRLSVIHPYPLSLSWFFFLYINSEIIFLKNLDFFTLNYFFDILNNFDMLILKINFLK
jgi:hypothetical protein